MASFDDMWNTAHDGNTATAAPAKATGFDSMWDSAGDDGGTGAADAAAVPVMPKSATDFAQMLTKPVQGAGDMLMQMARTAGGAAGQLGSALQHSDPMGPITALNRGFVGGGLSLADMAGNAALSIPGMVMGPRADADLHRGLQAAHDTFGMPTKFGMADAFKQMNQQSDAGFAAQHPQGAWGAPTTPDSALSDIGGVGNFIGQLFGPGMALAGSKAPALAKLAEAAATGEAYGTTGDVAQRYTDNKPQDLLASLYNALPTALVAGGLGAATHIGSRGGTDVHQAPEPGEMSPRQRIQDQIDEMFAAAPQAKTPEPGRMGNEQSMIDQAWQYRLNPSDEGGWGTFADENKARRQATDTAAATALMDSAPRAESLNDIQMRGRHNMTADDIARQVDDLFHPPPPEPEAPPADPQAAMQALIKENGFGVPRLDDMLGRMQVLPGDQGTRNTAREPQGTRTGPVQSPPISHDYPTPLQLSGDYSEKALHDMPEAPPAEIPPMVQALLDATHDAGEPARTRGFSKYRRAVEEKIKNPPQLPPPPEGTGKSTELSVPSRRDELATPPSWNDLTVGELKRPEYAWKQGEKAGIRKVPDSNKIEMVDKDGNVMRGKDGKLLRASYSDNNATANLSGPSARIIEALKQAGHQPITDVSARLAAKKSGASGTGVTEAPPNTKSEKASEPSKAETPPEVKPPADELKHRTGIEVPKHDTVEDRPYESWKPQNKEHKNIVEPVDAERRSARQAFIQQRYAELKADLPESAKVSGNDKAVSQKYRALFAREFDGQFNKQLNENPGGIKEWLASHDKFREQNVKKNSQVANQQIEKKGIRGLLEDEKGGTEVGSFVNWFVDPIAQNHQAMQDKLKSVAEHFDGELDPQALKRLAGMQTNSDIVRQYDPRLSDTRNKFLSDLDQASVDVEDPRTQEGKEAWREVLKSGIASDKLDARTNAYLKDFKRISNDFVDNHLKPRIDELKAAGVTEGLSGKGRLLRILNDDMAQLRGKPGEDSLAESLLREARGGYYRAIFLGNHEVAGLHAIEAMTAGLTHDPVAMTKAMGMATRALGNKALGKSDVVWDFMNAYKTRGMETHLQDSETAKLPILGSVLKAGNAINDKMLKKLESMPGGATAIDFMRAQIPEKVKIQTLRVAMAVKAAGDVKYPGGPEALMRDMLSQARYKNIDPKRQVLLDKARIQIYSDMNRLAMYSPLGFSEKTVFQRHGDFVKMLFPFTRSVVQQSRLIHSFGEDLIRATGDAIKNPKDAKAYGRMMQAVGRTGAFIGITALYAGSKAIPREADDELRKLNPKAHRDLHEALDTLHGLTGYGQTVEHLQPKLTAWNASSNSQGGIFESVKKIADTLGSGKKTPVQKLRAATAAAAFFQIDSVMGLVGSQKAFSFFTKLGDGFQGHTTKFAFSQDGRYLSKRTFKTDPASELLDWFLPGVPDVVSKWIDQKQEADRRKHDR